MVNAQLLDEKIEKSGEPGSAKAGECGRGDGQGLHCVGNCRQKLEFIWLKTYNGIIVIVYCSGSAKHLLLRS